MMVTTARRPSLLRPQSHTLAAMAITNLRPAHRRAVSTTHRMAIMALHLFHPRAAIMLHHQRAQRLAAIMVMSLLRHQPRVLCQATTQMVTTITTMVQSHQPHHLVHTAMAVHAAASIALHRLPPPLSRNMRTTAAMPAMGHQHSLSMAL